MENVNSTAGQSMFSEDRHSPVSLLMFSSLVLTCHQLEIIYIVVFAAGQPRGLTFDLEVLRNKRSYPRGLVAIAPFLSVSWNWLHFQSANGSIGMVEWKTLGFWDLTT